MELTELFQAGMSREEEILVEPKYLALHMGSGDAGVLATPWMIAFMEWVSHHLLSASLPQGYSSVGTQLNVRHLAATPPGIKVRVRAEILGVEGSRVDFKVEAWDPQEKIGEGTHERYVIEEERFMKRVAKKRENLGLG